MSSYNKVLPHHRLSAAAFALAVALLVSSGPVQAQAGCDAAALDRIQGQVTLPANCSFSRGIRITTSNTTLDCNGAVFDGGGTEKMGLFVDSRGEPLSNVTAKNCTFRNFADNGVMVTWKAPYKVKGSDRDAIYRRSPSNVTLERITAEGNGNVGVYIDDYVTNVTLKNSTLTGNTGTGVYLEHSSRGNKIVGNRIAGNGFRDGKFPREGLAVDSSADNLIEGNVFEKNGAGGIFLYKNCGEQFSKGRSTIRWQHSDRNIIRANQFLDEQVGVWLASRQSRNLNKWDCGDKPMDRSGTYFEDFANNNQVSGNSFCRTRSPVRNEGDDNQVFDNRYDKTAKEFLEQPRSQREALMGRPTKGTVTRNNTAAASCPARSPPR